MNKRHRKPGDGAGKPAPSHLSARDPIDAAMDAALRLLSVRERSASEIRTRLRDKGFEPHTVEQVLDRLQTSGLQDDDRFAERYAADAAARGKAGRLIQRELAGKGVGRELAAQAATARPEDEQERALALASKRAGAMRSLEPAKRVQRLAALLARRGFDPDTCWRVAKMAGGADTDDEGMDS